jgi:hypothetical protein
MAEEMMEDPKQSKWDHLADNYAYWMNRTLDDILTEYVRSKVRGPYHENIHYIHDLMAIEMYCIRGARHFAEGMSYHNLRNRYPEEYHAILSELRPDIAVKVAERDRVMADELIQAELQQKKDDEKRKERKKKEAATWEKMKGRSP